jgi:hypothetical protein
MGTTGHYVHYWEMDSTEKIREWVRRTYTWDKWQVLDLAPGTKRRSNWWVVLREVETDRVRAMVVITQNRAKREGMFYTKEVSEDMGPYATDIPKRLFSMLTPLDEDEKFAKEWRADVSNQVVRG